MFYAMLQDFTIIIVFIHLLLHVCICVHVKGRGDLQESVLSLCGQRRDETQVFRQQAPSPAEQPRQPLVTIIVSFLKTSETLRTGPEGTGGSGVDGVWP